jgi:DNA-directed RNA polymerase subunit RPC12/RpoP
MLLMHKGCNREVKLNIVKNLIIAATLTTGNNRTTVSSLQIMKKSSTITSPEFFCMYCGRKVEISEVLSQCMNCSSAIELDVGKIPNESNGIYCEKCFTKRFGDEKSISILDALAEIYIK